MKQKKKTITAHLPVELVERLHKYVRDHGGNMSWLIQKLVEDAIKDDDNEKSA